MKLTCGGIAYGQGHHQQVDYEFEFSYWREDGSKLGWKDRWVIEVDQVRGLGWLSDYDVSKIYVYTLEPTGSQ